MKDLAVIIPVCNEEGIIEKVITDWCNVLNKLSIDYDFILYDGASNDKTVRIINNLSKSNKNIVLTEMDRIGHGPTIVKAYKECSQKYNWIFQTDSDNEISPNEFPDFWKQKDNYDFINGIRQNRKQDLSRKILTLTSRTLLKLLYGKVPSDTNCPYRLMRSSAFISLFLAMKEDLQAPNIIVSAFAGKEKVKFLELPVEYKFRETGVVSIQKLKLLKIAVKAFVQTVFMYPKIRQ